MNLEWNLPGLQDGSDAFDKQPRQCDGKKLLCARHTDINYTFRLGICPVLPSGDEFLGVVAGRNDDAHAAALTSLRFVDRCPCYCGEIGTRMKKLAPIRAGWRPEIARHGRALA